MTVDKWRFFFAEEIMQEAAVVFVSDHHARIIFLKKNDLRLR